MADTLRGRINKHGLLQLDDMRITDSELRNVDKVIITACGTAYHAGMVAKYAIEHWTRIPCEVELASEFRYRDPVVGPHTLVIAISQSGETMDTLMALRYAREQGAKVLAICNTQGATIPRESDSALYTYAGPEIAVASTKAFLTQIVATYLVALYLAQVRGHMFGDGSAAWSTSWRTCRTRSTWCSTPPRGCGSWRASSPPATSVLFIGRHVGFPVALEGR